jgi:hypothetical protein
MWERLSYLFIFLWRRMLKRNTKFLYFIPKIFIFLSERSVDEKEFSGERSKRVKIIYFVLYTYHYLNRVVFQLHHISLQ